MKTFSLCALALTLAFPGCGFFDSRTDGGGIPDAGGAYTTPTLEVTINGVHFGPSAPTGDSGATLINSRDPGTGRITSSVFRMVAASAQSGANCNINAQRSGDGVSPIGVGGYGFVPQFGTPPDGTVSPIEGESVAVPQGSWQCTGSGCNNSGLAITRIESDRIEGYVAGTWTDASGSFSAQVVCSFYVPLTTYVP